MQVRLGVVVPEQGSAEFEEAVSHLTGVEARWARYADEAQVAAVAQGALADCDAVFFAGPMPLDRCRDLIPEGLPVAVARQGAVDLALAMLRAREQGLPLAPTSIDTFPERVVKEFAHELRLPGRALRVLPYQSDQGVEDIVRFHLEARARHRTHYAVTGRSLVYDRLMQELDVPVLRSLPAAASIRSAMNEVVLRALSARHSNLRFGAALYRLLDEPSLAEAGTGQVDTLRLFFETPALKEAWVEVRGDSAVLVFAHKGLLEELTSSWTTVPLIEEIRARLGTRIAVGFGLGGSARRSVQHAEIALRRAVAEGGDTGFLMSEDGVIIGPMSGPAAPLRYTYKAENARLREVAQQLGLGPSTLSRLADLERQLAGSATSAEEIAQALNVSAPSGRRIVRTLREGGLATPVGLAQPAKRGRPKNLYQLLIRARLESTEPTL